MGIKMSVKHNALRTPQTKQENNLSSKKKLNGLTKIYQFYFIAFVIEISPLQKIK